MEIAIWIIAVSQVVRLGMFAYETLARTAQIKQAIALQREAVDKLSATGASIEATERAITGALGQQRH